MGMGWFNNAKDKQLFGKYVTLTRCLEDCTYNFDNKFLFEMTEEEAVEAFKSKWQTRQLLGHLYGRGTLYDNGLLITDGNSYEFDASKIRLLTKHRLLGHENIYLVDNRVCYAKRFNSMWRSMLKWPVSDVDAIYITSNQECSFCDMNLSAEMVYLENIDSKHSVIKFGKYADLEACRGMEVMHDSEEIAALRMHVGRNSLVEISMAKYFTGLIYGGYDNVLEIRHCNDFNVVLEIPERINLKIQDSYGKLSIWSPRGLNIIYDKNSKIYLNLHSYAREGYKINICCDDVIDKIYFEEDDFDKGNSKTIHIGG